MKNVKILGSGCKRCIATADMATAEAKKLGIDIQLEKVTDFADIAKFGIASTPGVVIDGKVVHAGGLPKPEDMAKWLAA
ncbi:MAG: thioredoxin family protein [Rhodoblastus sp.]|nr:thioredoxin family protein [Rhodoblastus sp.]